MTTTTALQTIVSRAPETAPKLRTYRIEIRETERTLITGFHREPHFTDSPETNDMVAEFGSEAIAQAVIDRLAYPVRLSVSEIEWPHVLDDVRLSRLARRVADTGTSVNLLFWNPPGRVLRTLTGAGPVS